MTTTLKKVAFVYLICVPIWVTALAFIVGHVSYLIYVPVWLLNMVVMMLAMQCLRASNGQVSKDTAKYLIFPWMLFSIFGGMGPPPETAAGWAELYVEQIFRYTLLIIGGISMVIGFVRLRKALTNTAGDLYAKAASILITLALPFFIANMAYWGYFLTYIFKANAAVGARPAWVESLDSVLSNIRMFEVALFYLSTAFIAVALRSARQLSKRAAILYVAVACLATVLNLLPSSIHGPLAIASYVSYIPAITMLMPYFIAVDFLNEG